MNISTDMSSIGWVVADVARLTRKLFDRRLNGIGITRAQWQALGSLKRMGPLTQAALSDVLELETATVARLIDRLEAAGWVARGPDSHDRRVKLVSMTEKASGVTEEMSEIAQQLREDMLMDLNTEEREHLVSLLFTVKTRLIGLLETP